VPVLDTVHPTALALTRHRRPSRCRRTPVPCSRARPRRHARARARSRFAVCPRASGARRPHRTRERSPPVGQRPFSASGLCHSGTRADRAGDHRGVRRRHGRGVGHVGCRGLLALPRRPLLGSRTFTRAELLDSIRCRSRTPPSPARVVSPSRLRIGLRIRSTARRRSASYARAAGHGHVRRAAHVRRGRRHGVPRAVRRAAVLTPRASPLIARTYATTRSWCAARRAPRHRHRRRRRPVAARVPPLRVPARFVDSSTVVRATLLLTQRPSGGADRATRSRCCPRWWWRAIGHRSRARRAAHRARATCSSASTRCAWRRRQRAARHLARGARAPLVGAAHGQHARAGAARRQRGRAGRARSASTRTRRAPISGRGFASATSPASSSGSRDARPLAPAAAPAGARAPALAASAALPASVTRRAA
jgi:hypothetical protein